MNLPVRAAVFLFGLLPYVAIRSAYQMRARRTAKTIHRSNGGDRVLITLVVIGQFLLPLVYIFSSWVDFANYAPMPGVGFAGIFIWLAGLWLFWRAHVDLGDNWSVNLELRAAHQLVTHGVYGLVRHPMYAAFLLLGVAQALLLPNWLAGTAALVTVALMCLVRIPTEEAMMCEHFGQTYREYILRTGRVMPRIGA